MLPALPILAAATVIALLAIAAWGLLQVRLQTVVRHRAPVRRVAVPLLLLGLLLPTVAQASPAPVPLRWRSSAVASGEGEISSGRASRERAPFGEDRTSGFRLFLQVDPSGYADSPNLYAGFGNDPVNNRDPTGRYKLKKWKLNAAGQRIGAFVDFDDGTGGRLVRFEPYDPNSLSPRDLLNAANADAALYRAELEHTNLVDVEEARVAGGDDAADRLAYVQGSGTLADQPQQILDMVDGAVSLGEGDIQRAQKVGLPALKTWAVQTVAARVVLRASAHPSGRQFNKARTARDAAGRRPNGRPDRSSAAYVGIASRGRVEVGRARPGVHAEVAADAVLPEGIMTEVMGWRRNLATGQLEWTQIPVCEKCQPKFPPRRFVPGVLRDPPGGDH